MTGRRTVASYGGKESRLAKSQSQQAVSIIGNPNVTTGTSRYLFSVLRDPRHDQPGGTMTAQVTPVGKQDLQGPVP
jgi:hypothetical protein